MSVKSMAGKALALFAGIVFIFVLLGIAGYLDVAKEILGLCFTAIIGVFKAIFTAFTAII